MQNSNGIVQQHNQSHDLVSEANLAAIDRAIEQATMLAETVDIQQRIDVLLHLVRVEGYTLEQQNEIAMRRLEVIRKGGQILLGLDRGQNNQHTAAGQAVRKQSEYQIAIAGSKITARTARRWQTVARLSDEVFYKYIDDGIASGFELTFSELIRKASNDNTDKKEITYTGGVVGVVGNRIVIEIDTIDDLSQHLQKPVRIAIPQTMIIEER